MGLPHTILLHSSRKRRSPRKSQRTRVLEPARRSTVAPLDPQDCFPEVAIWPKSNGIRVCRTMMYCTRGSDAAMKASDAGVLCKNKICLVEVSTPEPTVIK